MVKRAVAGGSAVGGDVGGVGGEFEEENDAVDGVELGEGLDVEREQLFKLDVLDAELVEQVREDALDSFVSGCALS